jgi:hypothetical protein
MKSLNPIISKDVNLPTRCYLRPLPVVSDILSPESTWLCAFTATRELYPRVVQTHSLEGYQSFDAVLPAISSCLQGEFPLKKQLHHGVV